MTGSIEVLIERVSDIKSDITEIKNDLRSMREVQNTISNTLGTHSATIVRQNAELAELSDDLSEVKDRLVHLEYGNQKIRKRAVQVGSLGGGAGIIGIVAYILQLLGSGK